MISVAYGKGNVVKHKNTLRKHMNKNKKDKILVWFLCFLGSIVFVIVPYVTFYYVDDVKFSIIMRDQGIPLLAISSCLANIIEIIILDKKMHYSKILFIFFLIFSIICYFAYFYTFQSNKLNVLAAHPVLVSALLILFCFVEELVFVILNGE